MIDKNKCVGCLQCYLYCPDGVIYKDGGKVAIDYDVDWSDLMAWYDYTIDSQILHLITPNLESWVKGCPRASEEQLKVLRELNEQHLLKSSYE